MSNTALRATDGLPARKSGHWAREKLFRVGYYTQMFATGMKNAWSTRAFVDLMAGPGLCKIESDGAEFDGSPLRALKAKDPFNIVVLVEDDQALVDALKARTAAPDCRPTPVIIPGDCNNVDHRSGTKHHPVKRVDARFPRPYRLEHNVCHHPETDSRSKVRSHHHVSRDGQHP
jgi:hypothetical protein